MDKGVQTPEGRAIQMYIAQSVKDVVNHNLHSWCVNGLTRRSLALTPNLAPPRVAYRRRFS